MTSPRRAHVVGLGLIGGSICLALGETGWIVSGSDLDARILTMAHERGLISGSDGSDAEVIFIATPAEYVAGLANQLLGHISNPHLIVTDVSGVKESVVSAIEDRRFIGGHPMAGSEMKGLEGSRADLFQAATWVLTPTKETPPESYARLHGIISSIGASPLAIPAEMHDRLVAMASHIPHLVAGALMNEAAVMAESDAALLRLAAGGFRDMTRISAGDPAIWPSVLFGNEAAVAKGLGSVIARLTHIRELIINKQTDDLLKELEAASNSRRSLPGRVSVGEDLNVLRIPIVDKPGMLAGITTLAAGYGVNIFDLTIVHGVEGEAGVLELSIERRDNERLVAGLNELGFRVSVVAS